MSSWEWQGILKLLHGPTLISIIVFFFLIVLRQSHFIAQVGLELTLVSRLPSNIWQFFCLSLPIVRIIGVRHHSRVGPL